MRKWFSFRTGHVPVRSAFQIGDMDAPLRVAIWNALDESIWSHAPPGHLERRGYFTPLIVFLWREFFHRPTDTIDTWWPTVYSSIRKEYFEADWHMVYSFIEAVLEGAPDTLSRRASTSINAALALHMSGYRVVTKRVVEITAEHEIAAIESASVETERIRGARAHLDTALKLLSDRQSPDYRNSIKESVSAVEAIVNYVLGEPGGTLGAALSKLQAQGVTLHPAQVKAWKAMYGYTSDSDGIRHALLDTPRVTQAQATYMLVICSAFVSHLLALDATADNRI